MVRIEADCEVIDVVFSRCGRFLLGDADDGLCVWRMPTGKEHLRLPLHMDRSRPFSHLEPCPEDDLLIYEHHVLDLKAALRTGVPTAASDVPGLAFESGANLAFSRDGRLLAAQSIRGLELWDVKRRRCVRRDPPHGSCVALSPDGRALALGDYRDNMVMVRETHYGRQLARLNHTSPISHLTFSPHGRWLATLTTETATPYLWDARTWKCVARMDAFASWGSSLEFSADGDLLGATSGGLVRLWNVKEQREVGLLDFQIGEVRRVAFAPDGMTAAVCGERAVVVWDLDDL